MKQENNAEAVLRIIGLVVGAGIGIKSIVKAGTSAFKVVAKTYGDDVARAIAEYGDDIAEIAKHYGDDVVTMAKRHFADIDEVIKTASGQVVKGSTTSYRVAVGLDALSTANSKVLRQNLIDAGVKIPDYPNAAHHIVAGNSPKAAEARAIFEKFGIDINDAPNGVFLPTAKGVSKSAYHPSLHTNVYYNEVNNLLSDVTSKQEALDILNYISEMLADGTFLN